MPHRKPGQLPESPGKHLFCLPWFIVGGNKVVNYSYNSNSNCDSCVHVSAAITLVSVVYLVTNTVCRVMSHQRYSVIRGVTGDSLYYYSPVVCSYVQSCFL